MAFPEPVPDLKGKEAEEFDRLLRDFNLTESQKLLCIEAIREFPLIKK